MALETGINPNENMVYNGDFSSLVEHGQILLLDEPVMIYTQENIQSDCAIVLDPTNNANNQNLNIPEIVFDRNYFQIDNLQNGSLQNNYALCENIQYINERQQVDDGLAVLEILCGNKGSLDQPEFIDINKLSEVNPIENLKAVDVLCISDDDDVVFVREYKEQELKKTETIGNIVKFENLVEVSPKNCKGVRRNPVRKARINSKKLSREHILEEDFALLDTSDEEKQMSDDKENKVPNKKLITPTEPLKQWPVNAHERPEYNNETKKIEAFDYTIREIQKDAPNKKPRLETVAVRRKSKKKYITRKRKPRVVEEKKIPIEELKSIVNPTTALLKCYFESIKENKALIEGCNGKYTVEDSLQIFKDQIFLFSLVNNLDQQKAEEKLIQMDGRNYNEDKA